MSCSKRFAIPATEENRELIRYLFHGLDADNHPEDGKLLFTFTINRSGHVSNRKVRTLENLHRYDDDRCKTNEVHLLEVISKI
jgi:hypothetical protein